MGDVMSNEKREKAFNSTLGGTIGGFCSAIIQADGMAKDANIDRILLMLEGGNITVNTGVAVGDQEPMETNISVPRVLLTQTNPIEIKEASLSMDMTVSESDESTLNIESEVETSGSARVGWGIMSFGVNFRASVSVAKEHKRKSDYRATTTANLTMAQGEQPEALSRIIDSMVKGLDDCLKLNHASLEDKTTKALEQKE